MYLVIFNENKYSICKTDLQQSNSSILTQIQLLLDILINFIFSNSNQIRWILSAKTKTKNSRVLLDFFEQNYLVIIDLQRNKRSYYVEWSFSIEQARIAVLILT